MPADPRYLQGVSYASSERQHALNNEQLLFRPTLHNTSGYYQANTWRLS